MSNIERDRPHAPERIPVWTHPERRVFEASSVSPGEGWQRFEYVRADIHRGAVGTLDEITAIFEAWLAKRVSNADAWRKIGAALGRHEAGGSSTTVPLIASGSPAGVSTSATPALATPGSSSPGVARGHPSTPSKGRRADKH